MLIVNLHGEDGNNIVVASIAKGTFVAKYNTICTGSSIKSITFDSYGYMAVSCSSNNVSIVALYNGNNGTYLNLQLATSNPPWSSIVDASGRFVSISSKAINFYY